MPDKLDMSLDEIIKSNRSQFSIRGRGGGRGRGGRGRGQAGGFRRGGNRNFGGGAQRGRGIRGRGGARQQTFSRPNEVPDQWEHDLFDVQQTINVRRLQTASGGGVGGAVGQSGKLIVSNLDFGVSDADIKELFTEFGNLRKASVHYDRSGRSLGTADVIFERRSDAVRALKQYNGVPLDGRPMNIQLAGGAPTGAAAVGGNRPIGQRIGGGGGQNKRSPFGKGGGTFQRRGTNRGGARRGGNRGGGAPRQKREEKTAEQLDAEMDAYLSKMET